MDLSRVRHLESDKATQKGFSGLRVAVASAEEAHKRQIHRLNSIELTLTERVKNSQETNECLLGLIERVAALERGPLEQGDQAMLSPSSRKPVEEFELEWHPVVEALQRRLSDIAEATQEIRSQLGVHEERLSSLRTLFESKDLQQRLADDLAVVEARLEELRRQVNKGSQEKDESIENLDRLSRRLDEQERANDESIENLDRLSRRLDEQE